MRAILVTMGTDGDVLPFVGLGAALRRRGHRVTLAANEHYRALALYHNLSFEALVSEEETAALMGNADIWHPVRSALLGARWGGPAIGKQYALLADLARDEDSALVANPPVFAARLVQEKLSRPLASLVVMPWMIPSVWAPPTMMVMGNLPRRTPRFVVRFYWRILEMFADLLVGPHLNRVRKSLGLPSQRRIARWTFSRELTVGVFPAWYAPPQPDWPRNTELTGFPLFDGGREKSLPGATLDFLRTGPPPIAFTFGTGMRHGRELYGAAVEACQRLGARGILLTRFVEQVSSALPSSVHHCPYAPFRRLFPLCAAVVHHGGVGTTAQAMAAGLPQLILPLAWDQLDNATRVKGLEVGNWLPSKRRRGAELAAGLPALLTSESRARCRALAVRLQNGNALEIAADCLESWNRALKTKRTPG
jgi:rhamnosyltransferase subunit B